MFNIPSFMGFDRAGFGDPDAAAFFARVTAAGGSLTNTEKAAVNTLVTDLKGYGIWSSMKAIYPMVGASAAACAQNLKSSSFTGTFTSGWTFASTGVTGNGTSAYMNTGLVPNTNLSQNSSSGGVYINSLSAGSVNKSDVYFGASNAGFSAGFYLLPMAGSNTNDYSRNNSDAAPAALSWADCRGFYQMYRTISASYVVRRNNVPITYSIASVSPATFPVWIAGLNNASTLVEPSSNRIALSYLGDGLTDTQASNFYTAVQAFQTTLSRQV